jgi:2-polyprenyl-3-methyl-5-hydroxy-6-metoxy-1,4-benzoquinol methylase
MADDRIKSGKSGMFLIYQRIIKNYPDVDQEILDYKGLKISDSFIEEYYSVSYPRFNLVCSLVSKYLPSGSSILEVGPGYGFILLALKDMGFQAEGAELAENIPAYSKAISNENIPLHAYNIEQDDIAGDIKGYDLVIASEVLEHLHMSLVVSVGKIASMCRSGGMILITVPNLYRLENYLKIFLRDNICEDFPACKINDYVRFVDLRTHPREPTMKDLVRAVQCNQLEIIRKGFFSSSLKAKHPFLSLFIPPLLREHMFILVKKS